MCFAESSKGSYSQFYIVDNNTPQDIDAVIAKLSEQLADESITSRMTEKDLKYYEKYLNDLKSIPDAVKEKYSQKGGLYELDGKNTVFGQVVDGFEVLEAITSCEVVAGNTMDDRTGTPSKPLDPITIEKIEIVRMQTEETTEAVTEKTKSTKKTTQSEIINAATLPPLTASDADTTIPADEDLIDLNDGGNGASLPADDEIELGGDEEEVVIMG